jgi:hypothetical protein
LRTAAGGGAGAEEAEVEVGVEEAREEVVEGGGEEGCAGE